MNLFRRLRDPSPSGPTDWLVVGLGNPGPRYAGTRHNVGRDAVARFATRHGIDLGSQRFSALFGFGRVYDARLCVATPLTFMNLSGQSVAPLARYYRVPPEHLLLVYDDMDLPLGKLRLRSGGGSGGHNGVGSVIAGLGTEELPRLRLGIGRPPPDWDPADYVLTRFKAAEAADAEALLDRAVEAIEQVAREGLTVAMNACNR